MMKLKSCAEDNLGRKTLCYEVEHRTPGREGTLLTQNLTLVMGEHLSSVHMTIEGCDAPTSKEALDKVAIWLRRMAEGVDERKEVSIPI